jgi:Peptidase S24-like
MRWRRVAVRGPSMSPALSDGDVVLVTFGARPRVGDVVLVRWADRPGQLSVKRAASPDRGAAPGGGAGPCWQVRGDNPFGSTDSRELGPAAVLGVVRFRLWPRPGRLPRRPVTDGGP